MSKSLLEAYKNRINVAEAVYSKSHDGEMMDNNRKQFAVINSDIYY